MRPAKRVGLPGFLLSRVRRYDGATGELVWESDIPGLEPPRVEVGGPGIPQYRRSSGEPWMRIVSVVPARPGELWLQLAEQPQSMRVGYYSGTDILDVETVIYHTATGEVLERRDDLPRVDFASEGRLYALRAEPSPR